MQRAADISGHAGTQVRLFRNQVHELRRPELLELSRRLQAEARTVTRQLHSQTIDYESVRAMRDAVGDVADGMDLLTRTVDESQFGQIGKGFGDAARFLDDQVVPAAERTGRNLDELSRALKRDTDRLERLVREAPPDLKVAREIRDGLASLGRGIGDMQSALQADRLETMRDGFGELASTLRAGAAQADALSGRGPEGITLDSVAASVRRRATAEQDDPGTRLRQAAAAARTARRELSHMADDLPRLNASLGESRKVIDATRAALSEALRQEDQLEPLLKDLPGHLKTLSRELPRLSGNLARILQDTQSLRNLAGALRRTEKGFDAAVTRWPEMRRLMSRSADLLRSARGQLDHTLEHRQEYEAALRQTLSLAEAFTSMLPLVTDHLDQELHEQELALDDLGKSIDDFGTHIPEFGQNTITVLQTVRWLLALLAGVAALHGLYLIGSAARLA
jgi:ABC-type transporter Mla subunit MlaD